VLLVVLFHAGLGVPGGFVGVDVFFVISGFLITGLLMRERETRGRIDLLAFYARRVRRLAPAAIVVLAVTLPIAYALFNPLDRAEMLLDGAAAALSVGNIRFALAQGDYFATLSTPSPFLHFWSLGVEEQFYLLWPAVLLLAAGYVTRRALGGVVGLRRLRRGVAVALGGVFVASLVAAVVLTHAAPTWAFYSLPTRAFELAAGGLLAIGMAAVARLPALVIAPLGWAGLAGIVIAGFGYDASLAFPGTLALLPTLGTVALIAAGQRRLGPGVLLGSEPLRFVGRISYSLYLWHWPIFVLTALALGYESPGVIGGVVLVGLSIAVATISWAFVEEPFRRGLPAFAARPGRTVFAGASAMLALVLVANGMAFASNRALAEQAYGGPPTAQLPDHFPPTPDEPDDDAAGTGNPALPEVVLPDSTPVAGPTPTPPPRRSAAPGEPTAAPTPTVDATRAPDPTPKPTSTVISLPPKPTPTYSDWSLRPDVAPALVDARNDKERIWFERCLASTEHTAPRPNCVYGDRNAGYTVALIGDSKAGAFFPAFEWVANQRGWRLLPMIKVACPFIDMPVKNLTLKREYHECAAYNEAVVAQLNAAPPDLVVVAMNHWIFPVDPASDNYPAEAAAVARQMDKLASRTVILADPPRSDVDVPGCLSANVWDIRACATSRKRALAGHAVMERQAAAAAGVAMIDLAARICPDTPCLPVVDNMIVFRDTHHLTATFARSLGPDLERLLDQVR
jgi:peptidoglycan/LPS O-acetylase OafA/YrhL